MIPLTYKEQQLLMFIGKKSITFKDQKVFKDRHSFCNAIQRLSTRQPRLIKVSKQYLNPSKTTFKLFYKLTFDAKILVKIYLLPNVAVEVNDNG